MTICRSSMFFYFSRDSGNSKMGGDIPVVRSTRLKVENEANEHAVCNLWG